MVFVIQGLLRTEFIQVQIVRLTYFGCIIYIFCFLFFSFSAFIGKVKDILPEDAVKKHVRYLVAISKVLKNTNGSLPEGDAVVSVPYDKSPECPCPSLPGKTFILVGNVVIESGEKSRKPGLILSQRAFLQKWNKNNKDFLAKLQSKCGEHMDFKGPI